MSVFTLHAHHVLTLRLEIVKSNAGEVVEVETTTDVPPSDRIVEESMVDTLLVSERAGCSVLWHNRTLKGLAE